MAHETVGPQALLDNAFLFSAARLKESRRNVNILGLSALVDAIVMHQRLTVDTRGWNYFEQNVPPQWLPYIQPLVDIIDYKLPTMETVVKTLITDPRVLLTCYLLSEVDFSDFGASPKEPNGKLFDINYYYLTYTGSEIADKSDEKLLLDAINIYRPNNIPEMQFNQRWSDSYQHAAMSCSCATV